MITEQNKQRRQLRNNCTINRNRYFCEFQALNYRLNKLKKKLKKTDKHIGQLTHRISFIFDKLNRGVFINLTETLVRRHKTYVDEKKEFFKKIIILKNEIHQIEILIKNKTQCNCCVVCNLHKIIAQ